MEITEAQVRTGNVLIKVAVTDVKHKQKSGRRRILLKMQQTESIKVNFDKDWCVNQDIGTDYLNLESLFK